MIPRCCSCPQIAMPALKGRKVLFLSFPFWHFPENEVKSSPFWQTGVRFWTNPRQPVKSLVRHRFPKAFEHPHVQAGAFNHQEKPWVSLLWHLQETHTDFLFLTISGFPPEKAKCLFQQIFCIKRVQAWEHHIFVGFVCTTYQYA